MTYEKVENRPWQHVFVNGGKGKTKVARYFRTRDLQGNYWIKGSITENLSESKLEKILLLQSNDYIPQGVIVKIHEYARALISYNQDQEVAQPLGIKKPQEWFKFEIDKQTYLE